jgi:hypothetical protein
VKLNLARSREGREEANCRSTTGLKSRRACLRRRAASALPPGGRACGTLAEIWFLGMTGSVAVCINSCNMFLWGAARGETRGLVWLPSRRAGLDTWWFTVDWCVKLDKPVAGPLFRVFSTLYDGDLLFREPVQPADRRIDQLIRLPGSAPAREAVCPSIPRTRPGARAPGESDRWSATIRFFFSAPDMYLFQKPFRFEQASFKYKCYRNVNRH